MDILIRLEADELNKSFTDFIKLTLTKKRLRFTFMRYALPEQKTKAKRCVICGRFPGDSF